MPTFFTASLEFLARPWASISLASTTFKNTGGRAPVSTSRNLGAVSYTHLDVYKRQRLETLGQERGLQINLMHEDIFNSMHRI